MTEYEKLLRWREIVKKCVLLGCAKLDLWYKACEEVRAYEMRYNHNHDEKGRFCSGDGVDKGGKGDIINNKDLFHKNADPMYNATGSALDSNPGEVAQIIEQLREWGVSVHFSERTLGYGSTKRGKPGEISITKEASYSAWLHEFQHVKDDKEAGWDSVWIMWTNPKERERRERKAYKIEIDMARALGREDIVKELEENLDDEIKAIWADNKQWQNT